MKPEMEGKKSNDPWSFVQPKYDNRSSCYIDAGTKRGIGKTQPVGHAGNPKQHVDCLPYGRPKQMVVDETA